VFYYKVPASEILIYLPKGNQMTQASTNQGQNEIIRDVELHWCKLDKPVDPFGTLQWEISIQVPKKREAELAKYGKTKPVKNKDGKETGNVSLNLKKKALKADGTDAAKVGVVDIHKQPMDSKLIGNGSKGNVMVFCKPYEIKAPNGKVTKSGTSVMLTKIQVTDLVKYEPKSDNFVDFDDEGTDAPTAAYADSEF
jgi:hypothetical protein